MKIFRKYLALATAVSLFLQQVSPLYAMEQDPGEKNPSLVPIQKKKNLNKLTSKQVRELSIKAQQNDSDANFKLGKHCYKEEGNQEDAIEYFEKAEQLKHPKANKYLDKIKKEQLQRDIENPEIALRVFTEVDKSDCEQIEEEIRIINGKIEKNTEIKNTKSIVIDQKLDDELKKQLKELQEKLAYIKGTAEDVSTSEEWKKNPIVPIIESPDEIENFIKDVADKVYDLNESNRPIAKVQKSSSQSLENQKITEEKNELRNGPNDVIANGDKSASSSLSVSPSQHKEMTDEEMDELINEFLSKISKKDETLFTSEEKQTLQKASSHLQKKIEEISQIAYGENSIPLIVLVGETGAGKSTVAEWLTSKKNMRSIPRPNNHQVMMFANTEEIAHGVQSKTSKPKLWPGINDEGIYADCPGFNDTRGTFQKIKNSFYIQQLLKNRIVKFLLVIPAIAFGDDAGRGKLVVETIKNLKNMMKDSTKLKNGIFLFVTQHIKQVHSSLEEIKEIIKDLANKNIELKELLLSLSTPNKVALFSRPSSASDNYQNDDEKKILLDTIRNTKDFLLNKDNVNLFLPDDGRLLLHKMSDNLEELVTPLLKDHVVEKIRLYFNKYFKKPDGVFKKTVDSLAKKGMQYYTPLALLYGPPKSEEVFDSKIRDKAITHNKKSTRLIGIAGGVGGTGGSILAISSTITTALTATAVAALPGVIGTYYIRKSLWQRELTEQFVKKEGEKLKSELYTFAIELKKLKLNIFGGNILKIENILKKIDPSFDIPEIKKIVNLLECIARIQRKDFTLFSKKIWDNIFGRLTESIVKRFFQPSAEFYIGRDAPDSIGQMPQLGLTDLMEQIEERIKLSHISEYFIKTLLTNYSEEQNTGQNFSLTGSFLPEKKLQKFIAYMEFCKHIYTDDDTRGFVARQTVPTMMERWQKIIDSKKEIDRLYQNLSTICEQKDSILQQSLIYVSEGTIITPSVQVPSLSREAQLPKLEEDYSDCIEEINIFLQKILKRDPIDHKELKDITLAMKKLAEIKKVIYDEFSWHFDQETSNPIATITNSTDEKKYSLTSKSVVAASFLHKTQQLLSENITILDVGFRHLEDLRGMFDDIKERLLRFKGNPTSWFEKWGEVDYVAYIKEDKTLKRKDKLVIVYSGSNSSKDWVSNFTIGHTPALNLSVHEGIGTLFQISTSNYHNLLVDKIKHYYNNHRKPNNLKVITTGHSLGGALALLAAYYYKTTQIQNFCEIFGIDKDKISVKTFIFAAPAIADEPSQKRIEEVLERNNIYRIWTFDDPVVSLSGKFDWHVGRSFPLYNIANNTFNSLDKLWGPHLAERYLCYLHALREPLSESHKELTSILKKHIENINILTK